MATRYSYAEDDERVFLFIDTQTNLCYRIMLKRVQRDIAMMGLVDISGDLLPMPDAFNLCATKENENIRVYQNAFFIVWYENYELRYNGNAILTLNQVREQEITIRHNHCQSLTMRK